MKSHLFIFIILVLSVRTASALSAALSPTPPMGWNTWNYFVCENINEVNIRAQADALVSTGMRDLGYRYVNLDDCWQTKRDRAGVIQADPLKFPSGIKALGAYIHARGLKFGLYTDRGLLTCQKRPGSYDHDVQDAKTYAAWGVDFLKEDNCFLPSPRPTAYSSYERMSKAIAKTGRPILLSLCNWGEENSWNWGEKFASMWRTHTDMSDNWASLLESFDANLDHASKQHPGAWNDPDLLQIGNSGMSMTEYQSQMSLWAISAAPLIAGNDLTQMTPATLAILSNPDVIAVDQDPAGKQGTLIDDDGHGLQVYSKVLAGSGARAVAILNRSELTVRAVLNFSMLGLNDRVLVRDLWARRSLGTIDKSLVIDSIAPHETKMFRINGENLSLPAGTLSVSQLNFEFQAIGWGKILKRDQSIDRHPITLNSKKYSSGLAAHADSELVLALDRSKCSRFSSDVGVDDEVGKRGTVVFQVWGDKTKLFESPVMKAGDAHEKISVSILGFAKLRLVALGTDDGIRHDHADWADAKIQCR